MLGKMTGKEQQIKNSFIFLLPTITSSLFFLISTPIFTRILNKEDYGVLALAQVYAIFLSGLANFGMTAAYERNYFQFRNNPKETAQLLYSSLLFVMVNFTILAGITYIFRESISKIIIGSDGHGNLLFWSCCALFLTSISYYYLSYFINSERAKDVVFYTIVGSIVNLLFSLFMVAYLRIGVIGIVFAQLCSGVVIFCMLSYKFVKTIKPSLSKKIFIESLKISYPLTPRVFLSAIDTQFDKYMVAHLASIGGAGIYSIGQKIASGVFTYMSSIENVFSPQVYKRMFDLQDKGAEPIGKYLTPFAYSSIFLALIVAIFSEEIIFILTPAPYHGAKDIIAILAMFYGLMFFGKINSRQLIFMKKTHMTSLLTMIRIVINVGLNIIFIKKWGAIGAAWGVLVAGLISNLNFFFVSHHYYKIKWEYKKIGAIYLIFFCSSILILLLRNALIGYEIRVIAKSICLASYIYLGVKLEIISMENYLVIKQMLPIRRIIFLKRK